jgi:8-oxo-dGTP diphosphatase
MDLVRVTQQSRLQQIYRADLPSGLVAHPGGHLEHGESFEICAQREVTEETGLTIKDIRFLTATTTILPDCDKQYVTVWITAINAPKSPESAEPKVSEPDIFVGTHIRSLTI